MQSLSAFCDYFNVTVPPEEFDALRADVGDLLISVGGFFVHEHLIDVAGGTAKFYERAGVRVLSFSGVVLRVLRESRKLGELLWLIGQRPHRVSQLHCTLDVREHAPPIIRRWARRAREGKVQLSRKAIPYHRCKSVLGKAHYSDEQTGTVYLGKKTSGVWAKIYDKRDQLIDSVLPKNGHTMMHVAAIDPGPVTRYEICVGRHASASLRDVEDPTALFWVYGRKLLPMPEGVPEWEPGGEGYDGGARPQRDPVKQLRLLLDSSPDIAKAVKLADELGPHGNRYLRLRIRKMGAFQKPASEGAA